MLADLLDYLHNYFVKDRETGTYTIHNSTLTGCSLPLLDGQRIRIIGSVFWDGVWTWRETGPLCDSDGNTAPAQPAETFSGTVQSLAIPASVIALSEKIADWRDKNEETLMSPFSSESFGGYSYEKASSAVGGSNGTQLWQTWQDVFARQLTTWRKISM